MFHTRPSWTISFIIIMETLKMCGKIVSEDTDINTIRLMSDIEIPSYLSTLSTKINCIGCKIHNDISNYENNENDDKIHTNQMYGEWIYPNDILDYENHSKYILYIHGGAFCLNRISTYRGLLYKIAKKTNSVILSVNYRRAPEFKYPIPLNDCICAYLYLLKIVKKSNKIILAGDSAGGNLVISLIAYLIKNNIQLPSKCILISPWTDLTDSGMNTSWVKNEKYDFIKPELAKHFSLK